MMMKDAGSEFVFAGLMAEFVKIVWVLKNAKERGFEPLLGILPKPPGSFRI
jgi:hypothetical protein